MKCVECAEFDSTSYKERYERDLITVALLNIELQLYNKHIL